MSKLWPWTTLFDVLKRLKHTEQQAGELTVVSDILTWQVYTYLLPSSRICMSDQPTLNSVSRPING